MSARRPVSAVILTRNEERFIARAIASVWWADEVVILDSGSTDRTAALATALGARVHHQDWLGWRGQHEAAAALASHDWVFSLDADEIVTTELADSILGVLSGPCDPQDGYVLERREEFLGRLMPDMRRRSRRKSFVRLYHRQFGKYDPALDIHEQIRCPGRLLPLSGALLHWRNYTIAQQLDTLNRNADIEARMIMAAGGPSSMALLLKPFARFVWLYLFCGNWRFGIRGLVWSRLHATAEVLRQAKAWELKCIPTVRDPSPQDWQPSAEVRQKLASIAEPQISAASMAARSPPSSPSTGP